MAFLRVYGITLSSKNNTSETESTLWAITSSTINREGKEQPLCVLECSSETEAFETFSNIDNAMDPMLDESEEIFNENETSLGLHPAYYLTTSGRHVIASQNLLEELFDAKPVEKLASTSDVFYHLSQHSDRIIKYQLLTSLKQQDTPAEETVEDYLDDFLGAKKWHRGAKSAAITEGYYYDALIYPDTNFFHILWLPAAPYNGKKMLSAYGCNPASAKRLEQFIKYEASSKRLDIPPFSLARHNDIVVASEAFLTTLFGERPAVIKFSTQKGFLDAAADHRADSISAIYSAWNNKKAKREMARLLTQRDAPLPPPSAIQMCLFKSYNLTTPLPSKSDLPTPTNVQLAVPAQNSFLNAPPINNTQPSFLVQNASLFGTAVQPRQLPGFSLAPYISTPNMTDEEWVDSVIISDSQNRL
ncbi:hypothetical protein [Aquicella lusitana]|uniref:Uncharacterized protein n=1 Tax=Aquicella lusitana TaxID=254246 RepID=A0A370GY56_9COXI|nr:hypothetical protein [Aquicella lusitana]RDI48585.1 hypothetical protein C8D86_10212 [Aquicella lusitana]VVC74038.1 hypothetical protein AQULUS_18010 [Aquicella lusitana]